MHCAARVAYLHASCEAAVDPINNTIDTNINTSDSSRNCARRVMQETDIEGRRHHSCRTASAIVIPVSQ